MTKPKSAAAVADAVPRTIDELPLDELRKRAERVKGLLAELKSLFPGVVRMSDDDRVHSEGRFRDGESAALQSVLEVVDSAPQYFSVLSAKDNGRDPKRFETELLRERLERREILSGIVSALSPLATDLSDHVLHLGELTRPPLLAAYHIAKPLAEHEPQIASKLSAARSFYGRAARRGAETRKKKAEAGPAE